MSFIERFLINQTDRVQSLLSDLKFLIFSIGLLSTLGYLTVYSFLFGYYFSGEEGSSNFSIISNLIPFNIKTLSITSIFFICIYYTISGLIPFILKRKVKWWLITLFSIFCMYLLNMSLTAFFANKVNFQSSFSFSLVWVFIAFFVIYIYILLNLPDNPIVIVKGMVFSIFSVLLIYLYLDKANLEINGSILQTLIIFLFLIATLIFQRLYNLKWIAFISYFPFTFLAFFLLLFFFEIYLWKIPFVIHIMVLLISTFSTTLILFDRIYIKELRYLSKLKIDNVTENKVEVESEESKLKNEINNVYNANQGGLLYKAIIIFYKMFSNKTNNGIKFLLGILLLAVFIWTPRLSMICGQAIRTLNSPYENQIEINYVNQNGIEGSIQGNFYIENNSTLYISNSEWQIETIKPINYHIKILD